MESLNKEEKDIILDFYFRCGVTREPQSFIPVLKKH